MRFLFTMLDNPPGFSSEKSTAKLSYLKDDVGAGNQPSGGARRDRTDDLMLAKHALSQLSYGPSSECSAFAGSASAYSRSECARAPQRLEANSTNMVGLGGLEPPTSRLSSARSNQLSYKPETSGRSTLSEHHHGFPKTRTGQQAGSSLKWKKERRRRREVPLMIAGLTDQRDPSVSIGRASPKA